MGLPFSLKGCRADGWDKSAQVIPDKILGSLGEPARVGE